ncbi:MAG TPA: SDR family NAD(P)-dependent oxidoreductase [Brumimicrobium sp.]|nr:SDR family NAD(P)-dependent oxidoreductase [Brumimicrobium sp.]
MIYVITGTSSGIGEGLAEYYLDKGEKVVGISRTNTIHHPNFIHLKCDFSELTSLHELSLRECIKEEDFPVRLINNAGIIGDIRRSHELTLTHYRDVAMINIVAPQYLSSLVLQTFGYENVEIIINISSGAGQRPVPSWGAYCSSKAAIDIFTETLHKEIQELGHKTKVFAIAPGVVDTKMQEVIRNSGPHHFSQNEAFVSLKETNQLRNAKSVAALLDEFINDTPPEETGVIHRI